MDNVIVSTDDSALISQPAPLLVGEQQPVIVQENFVGGANSTIHVGLVETLPAGSQAYVNNVGTETDAIFNFGIPEGEQGNAGRNGNDGQNGEAATITIGSVTTGAAGTNVIVENVGTDTDAILNFTIPRGEQGLQGETGATGQDGVTPIAYVTQTSTGATIHIEDAQTVTDATVTNGTDGTDGTDGFSPIATVTQNTGSATISITDANGTTTATVYDGTPGTVPNDGTLTIQQNGTAVQTFSANQSSNATANILVPTAVSELSNDLNYLTSVATSDIMNKAVTSDKLDHVILWSGTDTGSGNISLSQNISTLRYVEIFFHDDQDFRNSIKIFTNYSTSSVKSCIQNIKTGINGNTEFLVAKRIELGGTTLTRGTECTVTLNTSGVSITASSNYLRFDRVIGYES